MLARQLRGALRRSRRAVVFQWRRMDASHPADAAASTTELGIGQLEEIGLSTTGWPRIAARFCSGLREAGLADHDSRRRLPVQVGASLKIDATGTTAAVNVVTGDNLEEIAIRPKLTGIAESADVWRVLSLRSSENLVDLKVTAEQLDDGKQEVLTEIKAEMPARWCGVEVATGSGSVFVQSVREGNLHVRTQGGSVTCGEVRGSEARIESGGGDVDVREVQASAEIRTGGGKLAVKRLQGVGITIESDGGNVWLGAVYGNQVTVESRGGSIKAEDFQGQKSALISSGGGGVSIDGIDGNAVIVTGGGPVELQLNEYAESVTVDAGVEGRVVLCLSSKLAAMLRYRGSSSQGSIVQEGSILTYGDEADTFEFVGSEWASRVRAMESGWRGAESPLGGGLKPCFVHVVSAKELYVKQRSWSELVTSKTPVNRSWGR